VEHATIAPSTQTKEEKMESTETTVTLAVNYNPDQLVTYKILNGYTDPEYATDKVRNIEWDLHNARNNSKAVASIQSKIDSVKSYIINAYPDSDDQFSLTEIAEILGIELTKEVQWEATIHVSGTMSVPLTEDYDLESELNDNLFVDSSGGDIDVTNYEVANVNEEY
jgi:hypothetical protein